MNQSIHIDIAPDGSTRIEAEGFSGTGCTEATAAIEQALGTVIRRERKSEFYRPQRQKAAQRQRTGRA